MLHDGPGDREPPAQGVRQPTLGGTEKTAFPVPSGFPRSGGMTVKHRRATNGPTSRHRTKYPRLHAGSARPARRPEIHSLYCSRNLPPTAASTARMNSGLTVLTPLDVVNDLVPPCFQRSSRPCAPPARQRSNSTAKSQSASSHPASLRPPGNFAAQVSKPTWHESGGKWLPRCTKNVTWI